MTPCINFKIVIGASPEILIETIELNIGIAYRNNSFRIIRFSCCR